MNIVQKVKCAVLMRQGNDLAARLLVGIYQFLDEHPAMDLVEIPISDGTIDPLTELNTNFDGAILWVDRSSPWVPHLLERGIVAVNCNRDWVGQPGIMSVGIDIAASSRLLLDHLTAAGRTRHVVAIGSDLHEKPHTLEKCQDFLALAAARGLQTTLYELGGKLPDKVRDRLNKVAEEKELLKLLRSLSLPAGIWCENDFIARLVCNAAEHLGMAIPDQLAVLGSGDHQIALAGQPSISTIPRRLELAGYAAARGLYEWILAGGSQPPDIVLPPVPIIIRQSTGSVDRLAQLVDEARQLIEADACSGLTVEALCQRLDVSKVALTARFTKLLGVSPGTEIRRTKVEAAKRMLRESRLSVGEIGVALGFSEHSKFSKFFKRQAGMTPSDYRAKEHDIKTE